MAAPVGEALCFLPATELVRLLRDGSLRALDLLELFIARIQRLDDPPHGLNAVVVRDFDRARAHARLLDEERAAGKMRGPLHGLPMTVKESCDVQGLQICKGVWERRDEKSDCNEPAVQRLIDAGAVVFAKTNVPVDCCDWQTYNNVYGATKNPWCHDCTAGGSSGGCAVALAARFTPLEFGSDVAGSIRIPAIFCGVFGLAPTYDVIPYYIPGKESGSKDLAVRGPLARNTSDLSLALSVLAPHCQMPPTAGRLGRFRVAVWADDIQCPVGKEVSVALAHVIKFLQEVCAAVTVLPTNVQVPGAGESYALYMRLLGSKACQPSAEGLDELMRGKSKASAENGGVALAEYYKGASATHGDWICDHRARLHLQHECSEFFVQHDFLIAPVAPCPAFKNDQLEGMDAYAPGRSTSIDGVKRPYADFFFWAHFAILAGLPSVAVPTGLSTEGTPLGIQVMGPRMKDQHVIQFAEMFSQAFGSSLPSPPGCELHDSLRSAL